MLFWGLHLVTCLSFQGGLVVLRISFSPRELGNIFLVFLFPYSWRGFVCPNISLFSENLKLTLFLRGIVSL